MITLRRTALAATLPTAMALAACAGDTDTGGAEIAADTAAAMTEMAGVEMPADEPITVNQVGLQTPESVLHDADADVYLVSNINGAPTDEDGNGFISRVNPDGTVADLRWIDGQTEGTTLNAPKGLALKGDTLFVSDITVVRAFHRVSGEPLGSWEVPGSTFLNDLAVGQDGTLYVSDSGLNPDFSSSGTDAIYRFQDGKPVAVAQDTALAGPNGLAVSGEDVVTVGFAGSLVRTVPTGMGEMETIAELPGGQLDGVVVLPDGSLLVSSWETGSIYHVPIGGGEATAVVEGVPSPADIGWDGDRSRVLIPVFNESRLIFQPLQVDVDPAPVEQQPRY